MKQNIIQMEGWEGYKENDFPEFEQALKSGGGLNSDNLMPLRIL
jgi:hypothetical protein